MLNRSILANLIDVYHYSIEEIGNLTDFQIRNILYHPKNKEGKLEKVYVKKERKKKEKNETAPKMNTRYKVFEESMIALDMMRVRKLISQENYIESVLKLKSKFVDVIPVKKEEEKVIIKFDAEKELKEIERLHDCKLLDDENYVKAVESIKKKVHQ